MIPKGLAFKKKRNLNYTVLLIPPQVISIAENDPVAQAQILRVIIKGFG